MLAQIIGISIDIVLIGIIIFFIFKGFKNKTKEVKWPRSLLVPLVIGIVAIPALLFSLVNATAVLATPVPDIIIPSNEVKITGRNTKGTLKGKTTPNTLVTLKEDVDKEDNPIVKKTYSNSKGKFTFNDLEDSLTYKLSAKNKYHKSKVLKVTVSEIPDSAYTKLEMENSDEFGDLNVKQDSDNQAKISGTSSKNAKIRVENSDYDTIKTIHADDNGKWSLTLDGPHDKKKKEYTIYAKVSGLLETLGNDITVKNPEYVKPKKDTNAATDSDADQSTEDTKKDSETSTETKDDSESTKPAKQAKNSKSEAKQGFEDDLNTYLGNQYPGVSFTFDGDTLNLTVPQDVAYLSKSQMKAYFDPIDKRIVMFASANDLKSIPYFIANTSEGTLVARTSLSGFKVYASK